MSHPPVGLADVDVVREAAAGRRVPVVVHAVGPDAAAVVAALGPYVDAVRTYLCVRPAKVRAPVRLP